MYHCGHTISSEVENACIVIGFWLLAKRLMGDQQMKVGVWFYGLGTALTGILDIAWGAFDASHQPIQSLGKNLPGQHILAYVAGVWLVAAGLAILWRRSARIGAAASGHRLLDFCGILATSVLCRNSCVWLANRRLGWRLFRARSTVNAGRSGSNRLRLHRLTGFPVAKESSYRRTLDAGIASCHLRLISPHRHSRLREHRPAVDGVWIFLGGVNRNRLHPGRKCNLLRNYGCPGRQASCVDAVAV